MAGEPDVVVIRRARPADADQMARVGVDSWRAAYVGVVADSHLARLDVEAWAERWRRDLSRPERGTSVWVAQEAEQILGFASLGPSRDEDADRAAFELRSIYLDPAGRRVRHRAGLTTASGQNPMALDRPATALARGADLACTGDYLGKMRGVDDALSVGERIAFYRARRGLTQRELGVLVGRSTEWVSSVERGRRQVQRMGLLTSVAQALRVGLGELTGAPTLLETRPLQDDVPAVRSALMAPQRLSSVLFAERDVSRKVSVRAAGRYTEQVWSQYQAGRLGAVIAALPSLLSTARALDGTGDTRAWVTSGRIHHLAATTLSKIGESDLAWLAAERAVSAAEASGDPLSLASAARAATHALLANGRYDDAMSLGTTAAEWLRRNSDPASPAAASLVGMLFLRTAVAAARRQDRATANGLLRQAERAATVVGYDANLWQTGFGPTNVQVHRLAVALDLGDASFVVAHGPGLDSSGLPPERHAAKLIDTGRALGMLGHDEDALAALLEAEHVAEQVVHHSTSVRECVRTLYRRSGHTGRSTPLMGLAERCRAVA